MSFFRKIGRVFEDTVRVTEDVILPIHIVQGRIKLIKPKDILADLKREKRDIGSVGESVLRGIADEGVDVGEIIEGIAGSVALSARFFPQFAPELIGAGATLAAIGGIAIGAGKLSQFGVRAIDTGRRIHKKITESDGGVPEGLIDDVAELIGILKELKDFKEKGDTQFRLTENVSTEENIKTEQVTAGQTIPITAVTGQKNPTIHQPHAPQRVFKDPQELFL